MQAIEKKKKIDGSLIFFILASGAICVESYKLGLGTFNQPLPGFFPFITGAVLGILSAVQLWLNLSYSGKMEWMKISIAWRRVLSLFGALLAYAFIMEFLGFSLSTFLFVLFLIKGIEGKPWLTAGSAALGVAVFMHVVFRVWLQVQLPPGWVGF
jgi:putative tricarboxylic transport membrane protein